MRHLPLTLAAATASDARLRVAGRMMRATQLRRAMDHKATALLTAGFRPYDLHPVFDGSVAGVTTTLAALSIGLRPSRAARFPDRPEGPWCTLEEARTARVWGPSLILPEPAAVRKIFDVHQVRSRGLLSGAAIDLLAQLSAYRPDWRALDALADADHCADERWPHPDLHPGPVEVPDNCVAVIVSACEFNCCGRPFRVGDRIHWSIGPSKASTEACRTRWHGLRLHGGSSGPTERLQGLIHSITHFRERRAAIPPEYAHRELRFYPSERWDGDAIVGVEPL